MSRLPIFLAILSLPFFGQAEPIPDKPFDFLAEYCLDCHDADTEKGEVNLDFAEIAWNTPAARHHWERALKAIERGDMPPDKKRQPSAEERRMMVAWLDKALTRHSKPGGTVVRRLNRDEYRNTIKRLFGMNFELPDGFPEDTDHHHFDTVGEVLVLSPPLMEAYATSAAVVADEIFPPVRPTPKSRIWKIPPEEMVISYSSGIVEDGAMRLASKCPPISRSCTWPSKVEIPASGVYRVRVESSAFRPTSDEPMILKVLARDVSSNDFVTHDSLRTLKTIEISSEKPKSVEFEAKLYEGQTIVFHYANAPLNSNRDKKDKAVLQNYFRAKFEANPLYLAAWQELTEDDKRGGFRGGLGWERVKKFMADDDLDLNSATLDSKATEALLKQIAGNPVLFTETIAYDSFENGPALEIHGATIEGPLEIIEGPRDITRRKIQDMILSKTSNPTSPKAVRKVLAEFLTRAFRRPVELELVDAFHDLFQQHLAEGHRFEQGMHLVVRTALISPRFLYREMTPGTLDDYDLANRLAYFLTSNPPGKQLLEAANKGQLSDPKVLRSQAKRLLPKSPSAPFVQSFTGQWLDTRLLDEIMPDSRLKVTEDDQKRIREEVEMFFTEMLTKNLPMTDFITPDFTFTSAGVAKKIYELDEKTYNEKDKGLQRVSLPRNGRHGGILGQAAVLMATANGVDTQPVVRGVWVLENVLGNPPPPPPKAVPAIAPDTAGSKTPRELLQAHAADTSCAGCHKKIDPIGFALENFDAVGRWRDHYPVWTKDKRGRPVSKPGADIDSTSQLPDGTPIRDIVDLKRWIVENIDQFSECLAAKLMTYATGREPNYRERKEIAQIVRKNQERNHGFRDLLLALIDSETFRTK